MSFYDKVETLALKKGESMFPFRMCGDACIDWDMVYDEWVRIVRMCKRRGWYRNVY